MTDVIYIYLQQIQLIQWKILAQENAIGRSSGALHNPCCEKGTLR